MPYSAGLTTPSSKFKVIVDLKQRTELPLYRFVSLEQGTRVPFVAWTATPRLLPLIIFFAFCFRQEFTHMYVKHQTSGTMYILAEP